LIASEEEGGGVADMPMRRLAAPSILVCVAPTFAIVHPTTRSRTSAFSLLSATGTLQPGDH
jgi:hypothetical protein